MSDSLVLTIIGPDRPGLVESVSQTVADHDGNWLESRMARLAGKFAGVLRVSVPESKIYALTLALEALQSEGLHVVVERSLEEDRPPLQRLFSLELVGNDRPGIIREISQLLASRNVNVDELNTECSSAPMAGTTLFKANARLRIPTELDVDGLRDQLEEIAHDLIVELQLEELSEV